jgi:carbonic anhydrase
MEKTMHRRQALKLFAGLALCPLCAPHCFAADARWSYEGADGPAKWGDLDPANRACSAGGEQSPINVVDTIQAQLAPLKITWDKQADTIVNNGHTIQLNIGDSSVLGYGNTNYRFLQFHFHRPSEHLIGGKSFPMEVHFVHANVRNSLAVIGVLMTTGKPNAVFNKIVSTMPEKEGPAVKADPAINPNGVAAGQPQLLPLRRIAHHAAVQRDRRLAPAHRADPGGRGRRRAVRQALSDERAPGAEGEPALRAEICVSPFIRARAASRRGRDRPR